MKRRTKMFAGGIIFGSIIGFTLGFLYITGLLISAAVSSFQIILGWLLGIFSFIIIEYWKESRENAEKNKQFILTIKKIALESAFILHPIRLRSFGSIKTYRKNLSEDFVELKKELVGTNDNYYSNNSDKITDIINIIQDILDMDFAVLPKTLDESQREFANKVRTLQHKTLEFNRGYRER